jgi:hypothetical protein
VSEESRVAHEGIEVLATPPSESRVAHSGIETLLSRLSEARVGSMGVEIVSGYPTHELTARTVPFEESTLATLGST